MAFTHKDWKNAPDPTTPISAEALEELEDKFGIPLAVIGETLDVDTTYTTDEASAIQTAIDNLDSQGGGRLRLPRCEGGSIKVGSLIEVPALVNVNGQGKYETELKCSAAGAGIKFMGVGDTPSDSRGGRSGGFNINGNQLANECMRSHAVNRVFEDIRLCNPKAAGGICLMMYGAQNNAFVGLEGEDAFHSGSSDTYGIVFDGGTAGHNFFSTSLNEFTGAHVLFDATGHPAALSIDYADNICFYGNMIERTDTGNALIHVKAGNNIHFNGGNFSSGADLNPSAEFDLVLIDNTATRSYSNIGGSGAPTRAISFDACSFWADLGGGGTRWANVFHLTSDVASWHDALYVDPSCKYASCKYLARIDAGSIVVDAPHGADSSGGGLTAWSHPSGAGKINTRVQNAAGTIAAKSTVDHYEIAGSTTITTINATYSGHKITLLLTSTAQVTDGSNLKLAGNFTGSGDRTLSLVCDGTNWYETARSTSGSSGSSIWYDAVVDGAAVGDGTTDDTTALEDAAVAAVAAGKYLWIPEPSSYYKITSQLDWRINNLVVRGSGMNTCIIKQATSNTGIVLVGGTGGDGYQDIGHLQLTYVSSPTSGHTNSIGLSIDHAVMCNYHDLRILNTATGVQLVDSASSGTTTAFSNCFTNINVYGYRIAGMYMAAANTNSTGNSYRNIYIKNDWVGAHDTATSRALFLQNTDEDEFEQLNVEWMTLASGIPAIHLSQARATFKGLHLEEVITPGGASEQAIVRIYDNSDLTLVSGDGEFVTFSSGAGVQSVFHLGASSHLVCDTFKLGNVTADADTVAVLDYEDATCKAEIRQLSGSGWDTLTNDDVAATPNTRRIGDTYFPPLNAQSGTTYTLALTDANGAVQCTNGSAITVTVPPNASVAFPIGTEIEVAQMGAGTVTLAAGSGVTINSRGGLLALNGQYAVSSLRKTATDSWLLTGDLA